MRIIERAAALFTVLAMPAVAWAMALAAATMWRGLKSTPIADAGFALEDALSLGAAAVGTAIAAYLALTGYAMVLGTVARGGLAVPRALSALAPAGWARVTATALGLSLSAGLAAPAIATGSERAPALGARGIDASAAAIATPSAQPRVGAGTPAEAAIPPEPEATSLEVNAGTLVVGWAPGGETPSAAARAEPNGPAITAPATTAPPIAAPPLAAPPADAPPSTVYVVLAGDSLWRITASLLGVDATNADVAAAWPRLYEANSVAIGEDPSLIHPGLHLTIPVGLAS